MNFVRSKISSPATLAGGGGAGAAKFCTGDEGSCNRGDWWPLEEEKEDEDEEEEEEIGASSAMADIDEVSAGGTPSFWNPVGLFLWTNTVS